MFTTAESYKLQSVVAVLWFPVVGFVYQDLIGDAVGVGVASGFVRVQVESLTVHTLGQNCGHSTS